MAQKAFQDFEGFFITLVTHDVSSRYCRFQFLAAQRFFFGSNNNHILYPSYGVTIC